MLWFALLFGFCALISVANIFYDECDGIPTISQTLAMDTFRGLTIGLFTFGIYAFLRVSERAFLFSIICFALAFVINMFEGPITHAELVSIASLSPHHFAPSFHHIAVVFGASRHTHFFANSSKLQQPEDSEIRRSRMRWPGEYTHTQTQCTQLTEQVYIFNSFMLLSKHFLD